MRRRWNIVVDLTLLLPGGMNGGIKPGFLGLFGELRRQEGNSLSCVFLTNSMSHNEFVSNLREGDTAICVKSLGDVEPDLSTFGPNERISLGKIGYEIKAAGARVYYNPMCEELPDTGGLRVMVLHADLLHRHLPAALPKDVVSRRECFFEINSRKADSIQTISRFSQAAIELHFPASRGKVFHTYLPICRTSGGKIHRTRFNCDRPYFFYPANFWAHKNHEFLLLSFEKYLQMDGGEQAWDLVLTGSHNEMTNHILARIEELGLSHRIHYLGHLADDEFTRVFNLAGSLVFPSAYEGFGMPPLEAMSLGVPVICSCAGSLPEIVGDGGELLTLESPSEWARCMGKMAKNPAYRGELKKKGKANFLRFSLAREAGILRNHLYELHHSSFE